MLKSRSEGRRFRSVEDIRIDVTREFNSIAESDVYEGIRKLYDRATRRVDP